MRRFRKVRHVPLPLLAVIMAAILFAELARCEREGAKETAAEVEKSVPRRAALTFDDGPNACYTPEVLEILKENEIPATFFLQGQCLAGNEEIVRRMHAEGHLIGNHTFHHVQLTKVSEEEAREEVVKTSNAIYEITGEYPVYIRPPFGEWREGLDLVVTMIPREIYISEASNRLKILSKVSFWLKRTFVLPSLFSIPTIMSLMKIELKGNFQPIKIKELL